MKHITLLIVILFSLSCSKDLDETVESVQENTSQSTDNKQAQTKNQKIDIGEAPDASIYQGECPKNWGLVTGASKAHVEKFIQNFFYVPENPGKMYSKINTFPQSDGSSVIMAATYNMQDTIVDQEMVTTYVDDKMTQCGIRFRCDSDTDTWVNSCD